MKKQDDSVKSSSSRAWEALTPALAEWILDAMTSMGFGRMTPVQASTIPLFMTHKDVVVEAVTGSGKTLAFLIPVIEKLLRLDSPLKKHHVGAIIISPTRQVTVAELASQIHNVALSLLAFHGPSASALKPPENGTDRPDGDEAPCVGPEYPSSTLKVVPQLLVGGAVTPSQDLKNFMNTSPNLLISTPGRLLELLSSPHVHCPQSSFEVLVLDEADRLLDLGFKEDLQKILGKLPKQRRTGLFSASVSEAVDQLIRVGLRNPVKVSVRVKGEAGGEQRTPARLQMSYLLTPPTQRLPSLSSLLQHLSPIPQKTIVYMSTCAAVDYFQHVLPTLLNAQSGLQQFTLIPLHGKHPPHVRTKNFTGFSESTTPTVLLTTDVAARGLDIPLVDLVVQLDPPSDPKVFLHRCGRAGRAGRKGLSVVFLVPGKEEDYVQYLSVRKTPITPLLEPLVSVSEAGARNATEKIRGIVLKDRALHDKAQKAFVSWVKAYSKHQASSIFRIQDTDWDEVGRAWGLLRMPKMPEAKKWDGDRNLGFLTEWKDYAYKDKKREEARKEALLKQREGLEEKETNGNAPGRDTHASKKRAWSDKVEAKDERQKRREKKHARRDQRALTNMTSEEREKWKKAERLAEQVRKMNEEARKYEEWEGIDS